MTDKLENDIEIAFRWGYQSGYGDVWTVRAKAESGFDAVFNPQTKENQAFERFKAPHDSLVLDEWQIEQFKLIADLIRNDWSGTEFDGRDVKRWILATLDGKNMLEELKG